MRRGPRTLEPCPTRRVPSPPGPPHHRRLVAAGVERAVINAAASGDVGLRGELDVVAVYRPEAAARLAALFRATSASTPISQWRHWLDMPPK